MHTATTRPPNQEEQRVLQEQKRPDVASFGCLTIFFGIIPIFFLGKLGAWIGGFASGQWVVHGRWIGWLVGIVTFGWALATFIPYARRQRMRGCFDADKQIVQEIAVSQPRVVEIFLISDNEPILTFDIGDGKILFLQGQWLRDPSTYGAPQQNDDPEEQFLNGLPKPFSFPSTAFTVTRLPHSGRVLRIMVHGDYLVPEKKVEALRREYEFGDSELLVGALEDIAGVLAREHAKRFDTQLGRRTPSRRH
jgi:hypothetical protein